MLFCFGLTLNHKLTHWINLHIYLLQPESGVHLFNASCIYQGFFLRALKSPTECLSTLLSIAKGPLPSTIVLRFGGDTRNN